MRRTVTILPRRAKFARNISRPRSRRVNIEEARPSNFGTGMISYSSLAVIFGMVALSTTPIHSVIPRFLSRLTNNQQQNSFNRKIGAQTTFMLGIFSTASPEDFSRRQEIRESYLDSGDHRFCTLEEYKRQSLEEAEMRICHVPYTFVISGGGDYRPTEHIDDEPLIVDTDHKGNFDDQGDCTYLNINENTGEGKSLAWFKYASTVAQEYGIDYIAKVDNMSILSPELFFKFQEDLPVSPFNKQTYGGVPHPSYHHEMFYAKGEFYFMSADIAEYIGCTLTATERQHLMKKGTGHDEDASIGALVLSHPRPIKFVDLRGYQMWSNHSRTWNIVDSLDNQLRNKMSSERNNAPWWSTCPSFLVEIMSKNAP